MSFMSVAVARRCAPHVSQAATRASSDCRQTSAGFGDGQRGRAFEVGDDAAGFANEQDAGGDVPRREAQLPERVEAAAGDVGEVERGGAAATNARRCARMTG